MRTWINGHWFGEAEAGVDMQFSFAELIAHAAKSRPLAAGTLIGSGTIANEDTAKERPAWPNSAPWRRCAMAKAATPFLKFGDRVRIEMTDGEGKSVFGAIEQVVERYSPA